MNWKYALIFMVVVFSYMSLFMQSAMEHTLWMIIWVNMFASAHKNYGKSGRGWRAYEFDEIHYSSHPHLLLNFIVYTCWQVSHLTNTHLERTGYICQWVRDGMKINKFVTRVCTPIACTTITVVTNDNTVTRVCTVNMHYCYSSHNVDTPYRSLHYTLTVIRNFVTQIT